MRIRAAIASAVVVAAAVMASLDLESTSEPARTASGTATARFGGVLEDCATRSEAKFPGAFTSPRNLVVGPLVLIGGSFTDESTVREFGGNKFPLLVAAGHVVTVRIGRSARASAGLAYGPLPQGRETQLRDAHQSVTFVACRPGKARDYNPDGPSGSYADGVAITFWSGFVLTRAPACIPLEVYVDDEPKPRRVALALGRRCGGQPAVAAGTVRLDVPSRATYIP